MRPSRAVLRAYLAGVGVGGRSVLRGRRCRLDRRRSSPRSLASTRSSTSRDRGRHIVNVDERVRRITTRSRSRCADRQVPWSSMLPLRIGSFTPAAPVVLAPMAGVTNAPFRTMCRTYAPDLVYVNEMVMATAVVYRNDKTLRMMTFGPDERPRSLQIYGSDPDMLGRAVHTLCEEGLVDHVDLNFGCPAAKVTRRGGGARRCPPSRGCCGRWFGAAVRAAAAIRRARHRQVPDGSLGRSAHRRRDRSDLRRRGHRTGSRSTPAPSSSTTPARRGGTRSAS